MFFAILLAQALPADDSALQLDLLNAARDQLLERKSESDAAIRARTDARERYIACADGRRENAAVDCKGQYNAMRAAASKAEVRLMGVRFDRVSVQKFLNDAKLEVADRILSNR